MSALSARNRILPRCGLLGLVGLVLLAGCLTPALPVQNNTTIVGTVTQSPKPPTPAEIQSITATSTVRPTRTTMPPLWTPVVYGCDALDLPCADFNQMLKNSNAELFQREYGVPFDLRATFEPFFSALEGLPPGAPTPTTEPTQFDVMQKTIEPDQQALRANDRYLSEIDDQPCLLTHLWFSPNGAWLAVRISADPAGEVSKFVSNYLNGFRAWLVVYDTETLRPAWVEDYPQGMFHVKWSPSGEQLTVLTGDGILQVRSAADGSITTIIPAPAPFQPSSSCKLRLEVGPLEQNFAWTADEQQILRKAPGKIETWDAKTGARVSEIPFDDAIAGRNSVGYLSNREGQACYIPVTWSPDARYFITGRWDFPPIWDARSGEQVNSLKNKGTLQGYAVDLTWSSTNLIAQSYGPSLNIIDGQTGEMIDHQSMKDNGGFLGSWSPDGSKIAFEDMDRLTVYYVTQKTLVFFDHKLYTNPRAIAWLADSIHLIVMEHDNFQPIRIFLYDTRTGEMTGSELPVPLR